MVAVNVTSGFLSAVAKLRAELTRPSSLMTQLGARGADSAVTAFRDQRLGDWVWPERYPGMEPPFINIAGAISDFNAGRTAPKRVRFQNRPALIDLGQRGGLWGSISNRVSGPLRTEWGTSKPYASLHQEGGTSRQPITSGAAQRIRDWLFTSKMVPRKGREGYVKRLAPLLFMSEFVQNVIQRPFLGITDQLEEDMIQIVEDYYAKIQRPKETKGGGGRMVAAV